MNLNLCKTLEVNFALTFMDGCFLHMIQLDFHRTHTLCTLRTVSYILAALQTPLAHAAAQTLELRFVMCTRMP